MPECRRSRNSEKRDRKSFEKSADMRNRPSDTVCIIYITIWLNAVFHWSCVLRTVGRSLALGVALSA